MSDEYSVTNNFQSGKIDADDYEHKMRRVAEREAELEHLIEGWSGRLPDSNRVTTEPPSPAPCCGVESKSTGAAIRWSGTCEYLDCCGGPRPFLGFRPRYQADHSPPRQLAESLSRRWAK